MSEAVTTPVEVGVRESRREVIHPEDGIRMEVPVFWLLALGKEYEYHHHHLFFSREDAEKLLREVEARCQGPEGEVIAERLRGDCWERVEHLSLAEKLANELMWEVKETLAEGHRVPAHVATAAGF